MWLVLACGFLTAPIDGRISSDGTWDCETIHDWDSTFLRTRWRSHRAWACHQLDPNPVITKQS